MAEEAPGAISLRNLGNGAAIELFDVELRNVIENILEPNTDATAPRRVTLIVTVKPTKERGDGQIEVACVSKLAPATSFSTRAYFGQQGDLFVAFEDDPKQTTIGDYISANSENVETLVPAEQAKKGSVS